MERAQTLFVCSVEFKEAIGTYAATHKLSITEVLRTAVATYIGYDAAGEQFEDKRKKYASVEERKEAQNKRMRDRRQQERKLYEAYQHEEHIRNILALEGSLK